MNQTDGAPRSGPDGSESSHQPQSPIAREAVDGRRIDQQTQETQQTQQIPPSVPPRETEVERLAPSPAGRESEPRSGSTSPGPDAPLLSIGRVVTALLHAGVLVAIAGLLLWYVMQIPDLVGRRALVSVVASGLLEIRAPTDGVFVAAEALPAGARVEAGQVLGHVWAPRLEERIAAEERRLRELLRRKLLLERPDDELDRPEADLHLDREFRECAEKIVAARSELDRLRAVERDLRIVSPVSGRIQFGLSGSRAVAENDSLVHLWPDGGDLVIEVRAPLEVIHELVRANHVEAEFPTADGPVRVTSRPIPGSLQITARENRAGKNQELWGLVQCHPVSIPAAVAHPGAIGTL